MGNPRKRLKQMIVQVQSPSYFRQRCCRLVKPKLATNAQFGNAIPDWEKYCPDAEQAGLVTTSQAPRPSPYTAGARALHFSPLRTGSSPGAGLYSLTILSRVRAMPMKRKTRS